VQLARLKVPNSNRTKIRRPMSVVSERSLPERLSRAKESNGVVVIAERDEMTLPAALKTCQSPWHEDNPDCWLAAGP
jgi:hypothetical protein